MPHSGRERCWCANVKGKKMTEDSLVVNVKCEDEAQKREYINFGTQQEVVRSMFLRLFSF